MSLFRRRYPLRLMLLTLIVGPLVATLTTVGLAAYFNLKTSIDELFQSRFTEVAEATSDKVRGLLEPADALLHECRTQAERGLLPVDDSDQLGARLVERLRYQDKLTWLSYGDREGRFTGAQRRGDTQGVVLNRSWAEPAPGRLLEEVIAADGTRTVLRDLPKWGYDPRQRDYYKLAAPAQGPVWAGPYQWWDGEGLGITCAVALRDARGVRGVFTADFHLKSLSYFLMQSKIGKTGRAFVVTTAGKLVASPGMQRKDVLLDAAVAALPRGLDTLPDGQVVPVTFDAGGVAYSAAFQVFPVSGQPDWATAVIIPQSELLGSVRRNTTWTIAIGVASLVLAIVAGTIFSARFARPLQQVAADLARVGQFDLSPGSDPRSKIEEVFVVASAAERMKASLRSFARYVPAGLVRETLQQGQEALLGARPQVLTIFFADIQGFSRLSETTPPAQLVASLGQYFEVMSKTLGAHGGTIDKYIGDGILGFFNAPAPLPDHPAAACRAALVAQRELAVLRRDSDPINAPHFHARIGLHTAEVLVGNIGTPTRFAYTVLGDGVNLASGIEQLNKVYGTEILVTQETRDAAGDGFEWRKIDCVAVKGRARGGFVFELLGESGRVAAPILRSRDFYERAVDAYCERQFDVAIDLFDKAIHSRPHDLAARAMQARSCAYQVSPPPGM